MCPFHHQSQGEVMWSVKVAKLVLRFFHVSSSRCGEALQLFIPGGGQRSPMLDMIEFLPETYKVWHWKIKENETDHTS